MIFLQNRWSHRRSVYWFDDGVDGFSRVPQSWRILYRTGDEWLPVEAPSAYATDKDKFNVGPVHSGEDPRACGMEVQLQKGYLFRGP